MGHGGAERLEGHNKEMQSFSATQSLRQKFLTSSFNDMQKSED